MSFGYQNFIYFFWVPLLLCVLLLYRVKKEKRLRQNYFSQRLAEQFFYDSKGKKAYLSALLKGFALFLLFFALLLPRYGYKTIEVKRKGVDILIALDVSPNRLMRAKYKIIDLLSMLQGDRIGLMIFAGNAFVQSPLTLDYAAVRMYLDDISADIIPKQGTGITEALKKGAEVFDTTKPTSKAILLLSDGEDTIENPLPVAEELKEKGVRVYSIGIGTKEGAPIPDSNGGFKKDDAGKVVISTLHGVQLKNIAEITGGEYVAGTGNDWDLTHIYKDEIKRTMKEESIHEGKKKSWNELYQWFGVIAFFSLLADSFMNRRKRNGKITKVK